jgi:hypothetical protein
MEISEVRKRLLQTMDKSRRSAADRRARADAASAAYAQLLERKATPIFKQVAAILKAENHAFQVFTPGGGLRLASDRTANDFVELTLEVGGPEPVVLGRISRTRGSHVLTEERPVSPGTPVASLTEEDILEFLLTAIAPLIER